MLLGTSFNIQNQRGKRDRSLCALERQVAIPCLQAHGSLNLLFCPSEFSVKFMKPHLRQLSHRWLGIYVKCHLKNSVQASENSILHQLNWLINEKERTSMRVKGSRLLGKELHRALSLISILVKSSYHQPVQNLAKWIPSSIIQK